MARDNYGGAILYRKEEARLHCISIDSEDFFPLALSGTALHTIMKTAGRLFSNIEFITVVALTALALVTVVAGGAGAIEKCQRHFLVQYQR
jgi:hypothetical protein